MTHETQTVISSSTWRPITMFY